MRGQGSAEYLLLLAAVLVIVAIAAYYITQLPEENQDTTIEGKITKMTIRRSFIQIEYKNENGSHIKTIDLTADDFIIIKVI